MRTHTVDSSYRQIYVADAGLDPDAPEEWNDEHVQQRFNALKNIVALCPEGDITARVICVPPNEKYKSNIKPEFEVKTQIDIESGKLGIFGWPRELLEEFSVTPGIYRIVFSGYNLAAIENEGDYYVVELQNA
jgi:hypothetical protein